MLPLLLFSFSAQAEYRVYQYVIKNKIVSALDQDSSHIKTSTLDPVSYLAYHGGSGLISIDLLRTWICPGHTGKRKICSSPYAELPKEVFE